MKKYRTELLKKANNLITGNRAKDYGDARENHQRIANIWDMI